MAFDFLSRKKDKDGDGPSKRDLAKAAAYFKHAQTASDLRTYDYAVQLYIDGLRHDPDNVKRHDELREVAKRRKVGGGKAAGFSEKMSRSGNDPVNRMLHEELLWAKNPVDARGHPMKLMEYAVEAVAKEPDLHMAEVAYWVGQIILDMQRALPKPDKDVLLNVSEQFETIKQFDKAVEACRMALAQDPQDPALNDRMRNLETELTMFEGRYGEGQEGDFRKNIRDADKQRALEQDDSLSKSENAVDEQIGRFRGAYEGNPTDLDMATKYAKALLQREDAEHEELAIAVLQKAFDQTGQYKFRESIGNVRMQQMARKEREAIARYDQNKDDAEAKKAAQQAMVERRRFDLAEYEDRAKAYPTDMKIRFELGRRYFDLKQYDDAVPAFQKSMGDPKHQAVSLEYLGRAYVELGLLEVGIESLRKAARLHPDLKNKLGMDIHYSLMEALEKSARETRSLEHALEAQKIASQVLQANIKYRDIRERMTKLRDLTAELRDGKA